MGHTYASLYFHFIWSTKDRIDLIDLSFQKRLYDYIGALIKDENCYLMSIGGISNHVHLLIKTLPQTVITDLMRKVKANSSKFINQIYPDMNFGWQSGYGVFAVSVSKLDMVKNYISNQELHHTSCSFEDEFKKLLDRHDISYEDKFLFD
ncbi:MAG: IS200/IS605 family transposase [bacterium]